MRLIEYFHRSAQQWPDRICLVDDTGERSYHRTQDAAWALAHGLRQRNIAPGNRVALYGENSADLMEAIFGILSAECVWVPINARNTPVEAAQYLKQLDVEVLLYSERMAHTVKQLQEVMPSLKHCLPADAASRLSWIDPAATQPLPLRPLQASQPVSITSSGGTTGLPKGILLTERSWSFGVATLEAHYPGEFPVYLVAAPLSHAAGGLGLMLLGRGAKYVILPSFDARAVMEAVQTHHITHLFLPPTAIYMMLSDPERARYDYSSIRYFMYAGAPMSTQKLREAIAAFGPVMTQFYAQMECFASITCLTADHHTQALDDSGKAKWLTSAGKPTKYVRVEIMDANGNLLPIGERGEIVVRSHMVFSGYVGAIESSDRPDDGWHHTGDIGYRDAEGFVYVVDRLRDMIISGGFNVHPTEVEQVVLSHPSVRDCAVVGVPDEKWGEAVTAVVELKPGKSLAPEHLIAFCRQSMSGVKTPKNVIVVDALPRSAVGKVLRRTVRETFWQGHSRKI
jgi:acyl-CoA synthetase (AMP-forming)/AMP-acid ligase II